MNGDRVHVKLQEEAKVSHNMIESDTTISIHNILKGTFLWTTLQKQILTGGMKQLLYIARCSRCRWSVRYRLHIVWSYKLVARFTTLGPHYCALSQARRFLLYRGGPPFYVDIR